MNSWLLALIAIVGSIVIGSVLSRIVRGGLSGSSNPDAVRQNAGAVGSIVFSVVIVAGLVIALGFTRPEALDQITADAIAYLPRALSAGIVVIVGNILATLASSATAQALSRVEARAARSVPSLVRAAIIGFTAVLAATQLGIDTTTINIVIAAFVASIGLAVALLVGFGGRAVSGEIAAGRALRRVLEPGDELTSDIISGIVVTVHSTVTEVATSDESVLVPNSDLFKSRMSITRVSEPLDAGS